MISESTHFQAAAAATNKFRQPVKLSLLTKQRTKARSAGKNLNALLKSHLN